MPGCCTHPLTGWGHASTWGTTSDPTSTWVLLHGACDVNAGWMECWLGVIASLASMWGTTSDPISTWVLGAGPGSSGLCCILGVI